MVPDISLINAGFSSLNSAIQITKAIVGFRDAVMVQQEVGKLLTVITDAQKEALASYQRELALVQRVNALEAEIASLKSWEAEKERYEAKPVAKGVFAYVPKSGMEGKEGPHAVCPTCFGDGKKEFLHEKRIHTDRRTLLVCNRCGGKLDVTFGRVTGLT